jgi:hypothetical protein
MLLSSEQENREWARVLRSRRGKGPVYLGILPPLSLAALTRHIPPEFHGRVFVMEVLGAPSVIGALAEELGASSSRPTGKSSSTRSRKTRRRRGRSSSRAARR